MNPLRPAACALALMASTASAGDVQVTVTGTVIVDTYQFGPFNALQLDDQVQLVFEVNVPGIDIVPNQQTEYDIDLSTFDVLHDGVPTSTNLSGPTVLTIENANPLDALRLSSGLTNGDFTTCEFDAVPVFFPTTNITQLLGSYDVAAGSNSDNFIITGAGGFLRMSVDTLDIGGPPVGAPYCFGDGSGAACPCGNTGATGEGCANGSGSGALLGSVGSASVGAADLVLLGSQLAPGQPGLYFQGDVAVNGGNGLAFGDGLRCAGTNVIRLQTVTASGGGSSATSDDIAAEGGVSAGDTRRYQLWYRDPAGTPCGAGFNLTPGYEITWVP